MAGAPLGISSASAPIYFNGKSEYYQFGNTFEQQIGGGIWYDF